MQKLKAPAGMTDVSFGGQNYKVGDDGVVEVPEEATLTLFQFGFTVHTEPNADEMKAQAEAAAPAAAEAEEAQRKAAEEQAAQEAAAKAAAEAEAAKQAAATSKAKK